LKIGKEEKQEETKKEGARGRGRWESAYLKGDGDLSNGGIV